MIIKNEKIKRGIAFFLLLNIISTVVTPTCAWALTGGPSQGEFESFEPAGASEMVNLFNGDFTYNIPLLDVDGYPVNISYHAGISPEQEATWVGLGWSLNPGAIVRGMRGLPDDFNGDIISNSVNVKNNKIYGVGIGGGFELVGFDIASVGLSAGFGIVYNNYKGLGFELDLGVTGSIQATALVAGVGINGGANVRISSQDGVDFTEAYGTSVSGIGKGGLTTKSKNHSITINSRNGMTENIVGGSKTTSSTFLFGHINSNEVNLVPNTAYSPNLQYPSTFSGFSGDFHAGFELPIWSNVFGYIRGYKYDQGINLPNKQMDLKSYGYFNLQNADATSATDFNRDADGTYYLECPKLPAACLTFDVFNVSAQGMGMLYRPHRNDFGAAYDNFISSGGGTSSLAIEANYGFYGELGINYNSVSSVSSSGKWVSNNNAASTGIVGFKGNNKLLASNSGNKYEPVYFKDLSTPSVTDNVFDSKIGEDQLSNFDLVGTGGNTSILTSNIKNSTGTAAMSNMVSGGASSQTYRQPRGSNLSYLSVEEASEYGFESQIRNYTAGSFNLSNNEITSFTTLPRTLGGLAKSNHISEVTALKEDGARYVFGIPVYNKESKEVMFNVSGNNVTCSNGMVDYSSGSDNSVNNGKGIDNYFLSKSMPSYAHSFLLTSVLSADYVDRTGNGPTTDDYGSYTKFNYTKVGDYGWRVPCSSQPNQAIFNRNLLADDQDDKGLYSYGRKDVWYVHSIETANYVAEFFLSDRDDALDVVNEDGTLNTAKKLQKLDKIVLYSKKDIFYNGANAAPLKTVHFKYDYSLCEQTPNSSATNRGKLTLTEIWFTYGKSDKGRFNAYKFIYGDADHDGVVSPAEKITYNPNYSRIALDRWGTYQDVTATTSCVGQDWNGTLGSDEFPYTTQHKPDADKFSAAWCMTDIKTPAGSQINVSYEADDYAYVQDQVAGQMATLVDMMPNMPSCITCLPSSVNTYQNLYNGSSLNLYALVDLRNINGGISASGPSAINDANTILRTQILPQDGKMYFKAMVQMGNTTQAQAEYVPGYANIDINASRIIETPDPSTDPQYAGKYRYAVIKLQPEDIGDEYSGPGDNVNPVSKAAWQMTRLYLPRVAYPGNDPNASSVQAIVGLLSALSEVFTFKQKNKRLRNKDFAKFINCAKSWVRLSNYTKEKIGGGHRVSKIEVVDNWNSMVNSEATSTYGQTYDYKKTEAVNGPLISSGVASYEPLIGGDEISLRKILPYSVNHVMAPNDEHFVENPVGEPFFPPPSVGYSKVTIRNIDHTVGPNTVQNIGRTEYEFFTSKDYPIKTSYTGIDMEHYKPDPSGDLFDTYLEDNVYLSQGFLIKLNDMHGKLKSMLSFQEGQNIPISGVINYYKTSTSATNELDNSVQVINENNQISNRFLGRQIDVTGDFRATSSSTFSSTQMGNLNVSPIYVPFPLPIPIPSYFSGFSSDLRSFQSATLTKIVNQQGILQKTETISDYVRTTTENILWDQETGDVVVAKTTNDFKDPVYNFEYPAHWIYKGMGGAFENLNIAYVNALNLSTGVITASLLKPGDEIALLYTDLNNTKVGSAKFRLFAALNSTSQLTLVDIHGTPVTNAYLSSLPTPSKPPGTTQNYIMQVIRSGNRNMMSESAGELTSLSNFVTGSQLSLNNNILTAEATEFSEAWDKYCDPLGPDCIKQYVTTNPYIDGSFGNWHEKRHYSYLADRLFNSTPGEYNIRKDGTFAVFKPFFLTNGGTWLSVYNPTRSDYVSTKPFDNWILMKQTNKISPHGNESETKDALNRYAASLFGYNNTHKIADATDTKYREVGNDNFEDYDYHFSCDPAPHFSFIPYINNRVTTAHTGRYSLKVLNESKIEMSYPLTESDCVDNYGSNNNIPNGTGGGGGGTDQTGSNNSTQRSASAAPCNCLSGFSPESDLPNSQRYVVSFWAKESVPNNNGDYANAGIQVSLSTVGVLTPAQPVMKTQIINGWQKFEYWYDIPANTGAATISFRLLNGSSNSSLEVYYDDFRIQPFDAIMHTYVYDPQSLRKWADLDERNFATFYEYDNEGLLVRIKKETEKGIITISETRNSILKQ